jgi:rRNA processing
MFFHGYTGTRSLKTSDRRTQSPNNNTNEICATQSATKYEATMKPIDHLSKGGRVNLRNDELNAHPRGLPNNNSYTLKSPATKSLLKFRQRQELQRSLKARQYKSYKRLMKQEGFDFSHGQRKYSVCDGVNGTESSEGFQEMVDIMPKSQLMLSARNSSENNSEKTKLFDFAGKSHSNPKPPSKTPIDGSRKRCLSENKGGSKIDFAHKKHRTTNSHQQKLKENERLERQQRVEQEKSRKLKERQQRHKLLSARTPRGQPIMNNLVQDILHKLQNEKADEDK